MSDLNRQQLCAHLRMSESSIQRLEKEGMPCSQPEGSRRKLYNLVEVRRWLGRVDAGKAARLVDETPRNFYAANARAKALHRMPRWADKAAIRAFYEQARQLTMQTSVVHQVDHIVPLQGALVSGLHVAANLQILTGTANGRKGNQHEATA